jgi:hypothetical protein
MPNIRKRTLDAALSAVNGQRDRTYGQPEDNFARIARLWNVHLINRGYVSDADGPMLSLADVALMLDLVKTARLEHSEAHLDSWTDKAGYAACGAEVSQR